MAVLPRAHQNSDGSRTRRRGLPPLRAWSESCCNNVACAYPFLISSSAWLSASGSGAARCRAPATVAEARGETAPGVRAAQERAAAERPVQVAGEQAPGVTREARVPLEKEILAAGLGEATVRAALQGPAARQVAAVPAPIRPTLAPLAGRVALVVRSAFARSSTRASLAVAAPPPASQRRRTEGHPLDHAAPYLAGLGGPGARGRPRMRIDADGIERQWRRRGRSRWLPRSRRRRGNRWAVLGLVRLRVRDLCGAGPAGLRRHLRHRSPGLFG